MTIHYPGADMSLHYARRYPGSITRPNVIVLHTTEGPNVTTYDGGKVAPNLTIDVKRRKVWEHFPLDMSSRALRNLAGGVETNTLNVVQIEILGSCDPKSKVQPKSYAFTDDELRWLGQVLRQIVALCPQVPLTVTSKPWVPYPLSYANGGGQRMTFSEWGEFRGICAHQHVPENVHGDAGSLDIRRAIDLSRPAVTGGQSKPAPVSKPAPAIPAPGDMGAITLSVLRPGRSGWSVRRYKQVVMLAHGPAYRDSIRAKYGAACDSDRWDAMASEVTSALYQWWGRADRSWLAGDLTVPGEKLLRRIGFTRIEK